MSDCENKRKEKGLKPCPASKICNPETTRCVKRTGRVGRRNLNSRRRRSKSRSKSKSKRRSKSRSKSKSKKARSKRRVRKVKSKSRRRSVRKSKSRRRSVRKSKIAKKSKELTKNQLPYKGDFMAAARARDAVAMQQIRAWRTKQLMAQMGLQLDDEENQQQQVSEEGEGIFNKRVLNYITQEKTTIGKWLNASPENFVMEIAPGKWEICSIEMMRNTGRMRINPANHPGIQLFSELWQSLYTIYYECPRSGVSEINSPHLAGYFRGPQINTDPDHQFVKIGTANWVVLRPDWYPEGQIPGSRIFRLVKLRKIKGLVSNYAREGNMRFMDLLSVDHCNQKRPLQTYRLEPVN